MKTPMGDQTVTVALTEKGGALSGTMASSDGHVAPLKDIKCVGDALHWKADVKKPFSMTMKFDVTIDANRLSGKFKPSMFPSGRVSGTRT